MSAGIGLREWLGALQKAAADVAVAALTPGSAGRACQGRPRPGHKRLRRLGFRSVAPPTSFYVEGTTGPLLEGEAERARRWGEALAVELAAAGRRPRRIS